MAEPKWTPGPWEACGGSVKQRGVRWTDGGIAVVVSDNAKSDARLIAAAPDLYEACEVALHALAVAKDRATVLGDTLRNMGAPDQNRLQFETLMNRTADRIEAALRKARGEE